MSAQDYSTQTTLCIISAAERKKKTELSLAKYKLKSNFQLEIELLTPAKDVMADIPARPISDAAVDALKEHLRPEFLNSVCLLSFHWKR